MLIKVVVFCEAFSLVLLSSISGADVEKATVQTEESIKRVRLAKRPGSVL